jgi:hypothetical protein
MADEKTDQKPSLMAATAEPEQDVSKAQQARLDEFYRTHRLPSGYAYNVRDGLHKQPKRDS